MVFAAHFLDPDPTTAAKCGPRWASVLDKQYATADFGIVTWQRSVAAVAVAIMASEAANDADGIKFKESSGASQNC